MHALAKRVKIVCILFGACLLLFANAAHAQPFFTINNNHKRIKIPFKLVRNMIVIPITINNKGPYNFVLDTGVGLVIITDPALVDSLNIKSKRLIKITGLGGNEYEAYVTSGLNFTMPGLEADDISAAILKKEQFNLSNYAGIPIQGLIGYEFFDSFAVKINFTDSTLTVGALKNVRLFSKSNKIPISIEEHKPYLKTNVRFTDGKQLHCKLVIDLGAGHALLLENRQMQHYALKQKRIPANLGVGLTGPITGFLSRINEIELGKYKLKNMITSFPDQDSSRMENLSVKRDGNLGINILKKFNMVIDYQGGQMYIKPNPFFNQPFEHDMSGMEYYADGADLKHIVIERVEAHSPAEQAGIETGDEIRAINFKPIEKMTVEEIDDLFQSRENRSLLLDISRHGKLDRVVIKLKKRI